MTTENNINQENDYIEYTNSSNPVDNTSSEPTNVSETSKNGKMSQTAKGAVAGTAVGILIGAATPFVMGKDIANNIYGFNDDIVKPDDDVKDKQDNNADDSNSFDISDEDIIAVQAGAELSHDETEGIVDEDNENIFSGVSDDNFDEDDLVEEIINEVNITESGSEESIEETEGKSVVDELVSEEIVEKSIQPQVEQPTVQTIEVHHYHHYDRNTDNATVNDTSSAANVELESNSPAMLINPSLKVATDINDNDTFANAFAEARNQVGTPGVFEWRGNLYSTYTVGEWNNLGAKGRSDYAANFNWDYIDHSNSPVYASAGYDDDQADIPVMSDEELYNARTTQPYMVQNEDIPVMSDEELYDLNGYSQDDIADVELIDTMPEVEVLGIAYDEETGANATSLSVDGNEVVLIDVDGNLSYDKMIVDENGDGKISEDEVHDISELNMTLYDVDELTNNGITEALNNTPAVDDDMIFEA